MTRLLLPLALLAAGPASAGEWSKPHPYVRPILNFQLISINGDVGVQGVGGAQGGVITRLADAPHWYSHTRAVATGLYGFTSGSLGGDFRVGSFIGPDGKLARLQVGPDVWTNGYGIAGAPDYYLPWSPGIDLKSVLMIKLAGAGYITTEATPGWAFLADRQGDEIPGMHELTLLGALTLDAKPLRFTVGYRRHYSIVGVTEGLILSVAL